MWDPEWQKHVSFLDEQVLGTRAHVSGEVHDSVYA